MVLLAAASACAVVPANASAADRYAFAGGCYTATPQGGGAPVAEQVRMKATALGRYMLMTKDGQVLAAGTDGTLAPAAQPSPAADFELAEAGGEAFALQPRTRASRRRARCRSAP